VQSVGKAIFQGDAIGASEYMTHCVLLVSVGLMLAARYYQLPLIIVAPWGVLNFLLFVWVYRL
jgi:hypothetical protein